MKTRRSVLPSRRSSFRVPSIIDLGPGKQGYFAPLLSVVAAKTLPLDLSGEYLVARTPERVRDVLDLTKQVELVCGGLPDDLRSIDSIDRAAREVQRLVSPYFPGVPLGKIGELVYDALM